MTALTAAAFAIALQCAPGVDPDLLSGFATVESAINPLVIHLNVHGTPGRSFALQTAAEAVRLATSLIAEGRSVDTGPFQINSNNLKLLRINLADTFATCQAAAAAARLIAIMSRYNSGSPTASLPYARRVTAAVSAIKAGTDPGVPKPQATPEPAPLRDALHDPPDGTLTDLMAGRHPHPNSPINPEDTTHDKVP